MTHRINIYHFTFILLPSGNLCRYHDETGFVTPFFLRRERRCHGRLSASWAGVQTEKDPLGHLLVPLQSCPRCPGSSLISHVACRPAFRDVRFRREPRGSGEFPSSCRGSGSAGNPRGIHSVRRKSGTSRRTGLMWTSLPVRPAMDMCIPLQRLKLRSELNSCLSVTASRSRSCN